MLPMFEEQKVPRMWEEPCSSNTRWDTRYAIEGASICSSDTNGVDQTHDAAALVESNIPCAPKCTAFRGRSKRTLAT